MKLNKLLNKYVLMSIEDSEKINLFNELKRKITSPKLVAECDFIPKDHPLSKESIIISDAFEALTNGMFNDEIMGELSEISESSLFYSWRVLIQGLYAFYSRDWQECRKQILSISDDTAPALYKDLILSILNRGLIHDKWAVLASSIIEDNREILDSFELIKDAAEIEDILLDTAGLLIRDLNRDDPSTAGKIMIWCLEHLQMGDILSDKAIKKVRVLFGDQEGYRLIALSSLSYDPDRSLVYWLHSLIAYLDCTKTSKVSVKAYLYIIKDVAESVKLEFELTPEYIKLLSNLINELLENLYHLYPEILGDTDFDENPFHSISKLAEDRKTLVNSRQIRDISQPVVQLELFSF